MCKYRCHAFKIRATSGFTLASQSEAIVDKMSGTTMNDVVSRNITMVLENLLMNYENNQLPTHGTGKIIVLR